MISWIELEISKLDVKCRFETLNFNLQMMLREEVNFGKLHLYVLCVIVEHQKAD
jgi:hypothetical protein